MKRGVMSWRIAVVILFIFGMGFATGKLTEMSRISKLQGYKLNVLTVESDAMMVQDNSTSSDVENSTTSDIEASTPSDIETSTSSDVETSTPSDIENSTASNVEMSTPSDIETSTSSDVEISTPSDIETSTSSNVETSTPSDVETSTPSNIETSTSSDANKEEKQENEQIILSYNAEKITAKEIGQIKKAKDSAVVVINANSNTKINKDIFDAIKGTNKSVRIQYFGDEWFFDGSKITETKDIDVALEKRILTAEDIDAVNNSIKSGVLLQFKDNGNLPAPAIIKLTLTDGMKKLAVNNKFNLYYYNESDNVLELVQKELLIVADEYVVLSINHNSKYILANVEDISENTTVVDNVIQEDVVSFVDDNITYLIVIAASLIIIALVGIIIIVAKNKKKNNNLQ